MKLRNILICTLLLAGCTRAGPPPVTRPTPGAAGVYAAGFDTSIYPGESAMRVWRTASPFRWVGYYLASPCHRDPSWMGTRPALERLGWGIALLYVGQQAFAGPPPSDTIPVERIVCSRTLLTYERGRDDGRDAVAKTAAEGFPPGTIIYLDVEPMQTVPADMVIYYQAWYDQVLEDGRFRPGTYAHRSNAAELYGLARTAYLRAGRLETPSFWVAAGDSFASSRGPAGSGHAFATVWQYELDVLRTFGGVTLLIDENVSFSSSPSSPEVGSQSRSAIPR